VSGLLRCLAILISELIVVYLVLIDDEAMSSWEEGKEKVSTFHDKESDEETVIKWISFFSFSFLFFFFFFFKC
jgi:hypothetical protein